MLKRIAGILTSLLVSSAPLAQGSPERVEPMRPASGEVRAYSFSGVQNWENAGDHDRFLLISPESDGMLAELVLKEQPASETLEEANERVNFFNTRVPEERRGKPKPVSGMGWKGLLQSQITNGGGHEYQLVAKAGAKTLVFYLGSPPGVAAERIQQLEHVILSLSVK